MKRILFLIVLTIISTVGFSQTKKIAHRSHSGSNSTFTLNGRDNFGTTPEMIKKQQEEKARVDSMARKAVADSIARITSPQPIKKTRSKTKTAKHKTSGTKDSTSH